jgi:Tol biopolymer transport system component
MPDVREVFQMSTKNVRPDRGFTERQEFRQRRRARNRKVGVFVVVGALIALAIAFAGGRALLTEPVPADGPPTPRPTEDPSPIEEVAGLYKIDPVTGDLDLILGAGRGLDEPEYAPNDPRLLYQRETEDGTPQIFVLEDGTSDQLTDLRGGAFEPTWSPDGTQIAFAARTDVGDGGRRDTDIFVMRADGSDIRNVAGTEWNDSHPDWSPDGSRLVFHSVTRLEPLVMANTIWMMALDTGELTSPARDTFGIDPVWTPDGASIVYTQLTVATLNGRMPYAPLWVMRSDGSGQHPLVGSKKRRTYGHCQFDATWAPDGNAIAFTEDVVQYLGKVDVQRGVVTYVTPSAPVANLSVANLSWGTEGLVASVGPDAAPVFEFGCYNSRQ